MIRYKGKRLNVNLVDYMLGFTREQDLRRILAEAPNAEEKPTAAKDAAPKRKIKTKTVDDGKTKEKTTADNLPMSEMPGADVNDASEWTKAQDEQIIKFKTDDPQGKWEDFATTMNMAGKGGDLKGRFAELKKDGKVDAPGGGAKKDEPKKDEAKKDEAKKDGNKKDEKKDGNEGGGEGKGKKGKKGGDGGGANDAKANGEAKAGNGKGDKAEKGGKGQFTEAEMAILKEENAPYEGDRFGWIASRFFDRTGKTVHPDTIKAALGGK